LSLRLLDALTRRSSATRTNCLSEDLCEDESFTERELAALVASKVYYQLGEYHESMVFALMAGKLFNLDSPGEYENTIIGTWFDGLLGLANSSSSLHRNLHCTLRHQQSHHTSCNRSDVTAAVNCLSLPYQRHR
jgi:hypothetical protein